ncbi:prophage Lp1 protein 52, endolysin [Streptococcus pseudoporcinus]|uniref:Prophage Lp1 protein 52, endolysin n=1 Tax=Streptococcus pseudoporcinus TaxID=361101 RepID=A0A4U9XNH7_9STRE|nr:phage tail spike protein [Streptococcus pseudoporcinus]VTS14964.1 prophage Lp1 protein 52, endolysin [Streptococcus pseudoporcinus]
MYKVSIFRNGAETIIHNPFTDGNKVLAGQIKLEINKIGQFDFNFLPDNAGYNKIKPFLTMVQVLNVKTGKELFYGRICSESKDMSENGAVAYSYNAKSELDFLNDSRQRTERYNGTKSGLIQKFIDFHNANVEDYKAFYLGNITDFIAGNDYIECDIDASKTTFTDISELILSKFNLEISLRKVDGKRYIDLVNKIGRDSTTAIKLTVNMLKNTQKINPEGVVTRLIPLGKKDNTSNQSLDISSVNNGKIYIDRQDLIDQFGIRMATQTFDDVTSPNQLKTLGQSIMDSQKAISYQYQVEAVNLAYIMPDQFDDFEEGNTYQTINPIMNIDERLRIVSRIIDIVDVTRSRLTIGEKFKSAEEWQLETIRQRTENLVTKENLNTTVENVTNTVNSTIAETNTALNDFKNTLDTSSGSTLLLPSDKQKLDWLLVTKQINLDDILNRIEILEGK